METVYGTYIDNHLIDDDVMDIGDRNQRPTASSERIDGGRLQG